MSLQLTICSSKTIMSLRPGLLGQLIRYTLIGLAVSLLANYFNAKDQTTEPSQHQCQELSEFGQKNRFQSWSSFYPYYLCEHSHQTTKLFHFLATFNVLMFWILFLKSGLKKVKFLIFSIVQGYGLAWISHFFVEQNKPATFYYPVWSFMSDFVMFKDLITGNLKMY